jgi:hypothetical protein
MDIPTPAPRPWKDLAALLGLLGGVAALYAPLFWRVRGLSPWDMQAHTEFAQRFAQTGSPQTAHFIYHAMLLGLTDLGLSWDVAAVALLVCAQCLSAALLYGCLRGLGGEGKPSPLASLLLSAALMLVGPLWMVRLPLPDMAFGWIMPTTLHSPTQVWLRPLALATFFGLTKALQGRRFSTTELFGVAVAALLCVWMKPNYALCALPALVPLVVWRRAKGQPLELRALGLMAGVFVGSLALQFMWLRANEAGERGFVLAPLAGVTPFASSAWVVFYKVALSLPFPALTLALLGPRLSSQERVGPWLAAAAVAVGVAQMLLLAEVGPRADHGNWLWGAQVCLWLWFIVAARSLVGAPSSPQARLLWALLALHVVGGALYVGYALLAPDPFFDMIISAPL